MNIEPSGSSNYYENHHIIPRSLNGSNSSENLVLLTAREHFICHWLLVKIFPKGSDERRKNVVRTVEYEKKSYTVK